jgi:succinyl-CoA reductase
MAAERANHFINGESVPPSKSHYETLYDPSTGKVTGEVARGTPADAGSAIDSASDRAELWAGTPGHERARILRTISERIQKDKEEMATLISQEVGKPIKDSRYEVDRAVGVFAMAAEEIRQMTGETFPIDAYALPKGNEDRLVFTIREPLGVVVAISPFNYPLNLLSHKVAPALAVGNTVVAKPTSVAPFTALRLAWHAFEAGVPAGVFNVVLGSGSDVGMALVENAKTRLVTFTGSTQVGRQIAERAGRGAKRVILEMGGMDPLLVFRDANMAAAVESALRGSFGYSGQVCTATKRIFVEEDVAERFSTSLAKKAKELKVGQALEESTEVGPVIDEAALDRLEEMVRDAVARDARVLAGGGRLSGLGEGHYFAPTVLDRVSLDSSVMIEEPFGPIAPIMRFTSEEQAVMMANATAYGLQAAVYTNDLSRALRVAKLLHAGGVHLNDTTAMRWDALPFGGMKQSGLGREGLKYAMQEMTEIKTVSIGGLAMPKAAH